MADLRSRSIEDQVVSVMRKDVHYNPARVYRLWAKKFPPMWGTWNSKNEYTACRDAMRRLIKKGIVKRPSKGVYVRVK